MTYPLHKRGRHHRRRSDDIRIREERRSPADLARLSRIWLEQAALEQAAKREHDADDDGDAHG